IAALDLVMPQAMTSLKGSGVGLSEAAVTPMKLPFGLIVTSAAAEKMMGAPLASITPGAAGRSVLVNVRFAERAVDAPARNVVAIVRGSDPALRGEFVAVGAHSDHIAPARMPVDHDSLRAYNRIMRPNGADSRVARTTGATPEEWTTIRSILDSLRRLRPPRPDSIFNGADDDGSGSVALLEMAESLAGSTRPRRSILFVWHTGEEAGLLGSAWFTEHPTVSHDSIVAQLNMDMVGRGTAKDTPSGGPRNIQVIGSRRLSTDLGNVLDSVNAKAAQPYRIDYSLDAPRHIQNRYCRSDHYMYARTGIPIAYLSRGYHQDYHMVTDEPQYIDYDGLAHVATFVRDVALAVANRSDRVRVDKPKPNPLAPCQQ
ncbi:MAG: M28 family peptidase, partial [Gemmatimonadales bacterium]